MQAEAQDPRFAQFYAAPSQLNPAMLGVFEGSWRVHANYRDQWSSVLNDRPFRTIAAGYDQRIRVVNSDYMGVGVSILRDDRVGSGGFTINRAQFGANYQKQLAGKYSDNAQYLIAGGQIGAGQHTVDLNSLWFSPQYNPATGAPDASVSANEPLVDNGNDATDVYLDFNAGLLWYALFGENLSLYAGGALFHLTGPEVSFSNMDPEPIYTRWVGHMGGEIPLTRELSLLPAIMVTGQGPYLSTTTGANFRYTNHDWRELAIRVGLWSHASRRLESGFLMDAMTVAAILEVERFNLGLSYDINTSNFDLATNSRGAFELSLIYVHPPKNRRFKTKCPKF